MRVPIHEQPGIAMVDNTGIGSGFGIFAGLLIPGRGDPIPNAALVVKDEIIEWVGPEDEIPAKYLTQLEFCRVPVLMPYATSLFFLTNV